MSQSTALVQTTGSLAQHGCDDDDELIDLWLQTGRRKSKRTREEYAHDIVEFRLGVPKPLHQITIRDLIAYGATLETRRTRHDQPLGWRTINRKKSAIKSLLTYGQQCGYLQYNVGSAWTLSEKKADLAERIVGEEIVARIIALEPDVRNRLLCKLIYASGGRVSEIVGLKWRDLQPRVEGGQVTLFGKGGKTRAVLLPPGLWHELLALRGESDEDDPVFASRRSDGKGDGHLTKVQAWRVIKAASRRAGAPNAFSPHWFRHAHVSHALDRGAPATLVRDTVGHLSLNTTNRYAHARPNESSTRFLPID